jgi:hypothetical protein
MPSTPTSSGSKKPDDKSGGGTYYAWNTFPVEWDDYGSVTKKVMPGDTVAQSDLNVSDEEWESLIESGAVSEDEYPELPPQVSPAEYAAQDDVHNAMKSDIAAHEQMMEDQVNPQESDAPASDAATGTASDTSKTTGGAASSSSSK